MNVRYLSGSRIPNPAMFGLEECRQQPIHLQEAAAGQLDAAVVNCQVASLGEFAEWAREVFENVGAELALEVAGLQAAGFQLQHHLAEQALMRRHRQGPAEWQLAPAKHIDILFPAIDVLHVDTGNIAKRG